MDQRAKFFGVLFVVLLVVITSTLTASFEKTKPSSSPPTAPVSVGDLVEESVNDDNEKEIESENNDQITTLGSQTLESQTLDQIKPLEEHNEKEDEKPEKPLEEHKEQEDEKEAGLVNKPPHEHKPNWEQVEQEVDEPKEQEVQLVQHELNQHEEVEEVPVETPSEAGDALQYDELPFDQLPVSSLAETSPETFRDMRNVDIKADMELLIGPCLPSNNGVKIRGSHSHQNMRAHLTLSGGHGHHTAEVDKGFGFHYFDGRKNSFEKDVKHDSKSWKLGGNAHIFVRWNDGTEEYVGSCHDLKVQAMKKKAPFTTRRVDHELNTTCSSDGSDIHVSGAASMKGLKGHFLFRKGRHEVSLDDFQVENVFDGSKDVVVPKQPAFGGIGGNPDLSSFVMSNNEIIRRKDSPKCVH